MPRKGMRSVFFRSSTVLPPSSPTTSPPSSGSSSVTRSLHHRSRFSPTVFSFSESMLTKTLTLAEEIIGKWNLENDKFSKAIYLFQEETRTEAKEFIKCIRDLQRAMNFLLYEDANSQKLIQAQGLMQIGMKRLEKEFYHILSANRDHLDPELVSGRTSKSTTRTTPSRLSASSTMGFSEFEDEAGEDEEDEDGIQAAENSITKVEQASSFAMVDIKMIADCMISCGYGKECIKIYKIIRKSIVDEGLYRLGIVHIKSHLIKKMDWEVLELKIKTWLEAVKIGVRTLFFAERVLCDYVFANSDAMRESCFTGICRDGGRILFGFPKKVAKMKKPAPEKVFLMLDLYSAIADLWNEIESIFSFESTSPVRSKAVGSLTRLGDVVRAMVSEFESAVQKDNSKLQIHGGSVHPLTRYATNFIVLLLDYETPLSDIVADWPLPVQAPMVESYSPKYNSDNTPPSPLTSRIAWLILVLLCKIDTKVEFYKDVALSYLFLANNLNFVLSKVKTSNLRMILSDKWLMKHEKKVKQYVLNYEKIGWNKVVSALPENLNDEITPDEVKFRVKRFNSAFETTYRTQASWVVPDNKLRDDIEVLLCKKIVPVYTEFYERYRDIDINSMFKYRPDELTSYISGLFYDKRGSSNASSHESLGPGQLQRCGTM